MGDGSKIDVWGHRWLPAQDHSKIISPRLNSSVIHVKDLFYPGTRIWDPGLLERTFFPWEAELIKVIPVSEGRVEDLLIWPSTPDGNYSVQSAYRMLIDEVSCQEPGTSAPEGFQQVWKGIWKIWTPNKICHFIWLAARDSLPTKLSLKARHLPVEDTCELCGDFQETTLHSLWLCEHAQAVWKSDINFVQYYRKGFRSFF